MIALVAALSVVLAKEPPIEAFTADGGEVPVVAPRAVDEVAPLLAPERVPDGGTVIVPAPSLSVYQVDLPVEVAATAASVALFVIVDTFITPTLQGDTCRKTVGNGLCDPADLTDFDRYAVGRVSPGWNLFSNIALATSIALPVVYLALESITLPTKTPWHDFADDALIVAESMAMTSAFQLLLKFAFRRPRPERYIAMEDPTTNVDSVLSFPSGHTMLVASATTALTTTVFFRHPKSPLRFVALVSGVTLTTLTAFSRVESGNHFPSDVVMGAFLGCFSGFIVPYLHRKKLPVQPVSGFDPLTGGSSMGINGSF